MEKPDTEMLTGDTFSRAGTRMLTRTQDFCMMRTGHGTSWLHLS